VLKALLADICCVLKFTGSQVLLEKLQKYKPKIAVFNGKLIFEVFSGKKDFSFGRQPEFVDGTNTVSLYILFFLLGIYE
jgi:mismatch-specific thymine-DNA glycosylase